MPPSLSTHHNPSVSPAKRCYGARYRTRSYNRVRHKARTASETETFHTHKPSKNKERKLSYEDSNQYHLKHFRPRLGCSFHGFPLITNKQKETVMKNIPIRAISPLETRGADLPKLNPLANTYLKLLEKSEGSNKTDALVATAFLDTAKEIVRADPHTQYVIKLALNDAIDRHELNKFVKQYGTEKIESWQSLAFKAGSESLTASAGYFRGNHL